MKRIILTMLGTVFWFSAFSQSIERQVFASSGGHGQMPNAGLCWTIGESVIVTISNGNNTLTQGFQQPHDNCPGQPIAVSYTVTDVSTPSGNDGAIDVTISGGVQPYDISWLETSDITEDISGLVAGNYTIFITDDCGDFFTTKIEVHDACEQPTGVQVTPLSGDSALVTWDFCPNATKWQIQWRVHPSEGGGPPNNMIINSGSATSALFTGLTPGTLHQMRIRKNCDGPLSPWRFRVFTTPVLRETDGSATEKMLLFPNPADEVVTLHYTSIDDYVARVEVFNVLGKIVISETVEMMKGNNRSTLDVATLASGSYMVRISGGGNVTTSQFIKR